jgi:mannose-6-phosphate isomerase-like protein (cupin superfamily)
MLCLAVVVILPLGAREPLAVRIVRTDPAKYRPSKSVHGGAGQLDYMALFDAHSLDTNLFFLHRGVIEPKSGIGHHFHNQCEEMFVIFDGEAEFTIDGRTSALKGTVGAPCRRGHSHAIYNPSDHPVEFMNINVTATKGLYDAFNLNDARTNVAKDPIPVFMTMRLDAELLRPFEAYHGGEGTARYRRALDPSVFETNWSYMDHLLLPPGASEGSHRHPGIEEVYFVLKGDGEALVNGETAGIHKGDAVPVLLNEAHSFKNNSPRDLEFMIIGIATRKGVLETVPVLPGGRRGAQ